MALLKLINFLPKSTIFNADQIRGSSWNHTFKSIVFLYNTIPLVLVITAFILGFIFAFCEAGLYLLSRIKGLGARKAQGSPPRDQSISI